MSLNMKPLYIAKSERTIRQVMLREQLFMLVVIAMLLLPS